MGGHDDLPGWPVRRPRAQPSHRPSAVRRKAPSSSIRDAAERAPSRDRARTGAGNTSAARPTACRRCRRRRCARRRGRSPADPSLVTFLDESDDRLLGRAVVPGWKMVSGLGVDSGATRLPASTGKHAAHHGGSVVIMRHCPPQRCRESRPGWRVRPVAERARGLVQRASVPAAFLQLRQHLIEREAARASAAAGTPHMSADAGRR